MPAEPSRSTADARSPARAHPSPLVLAPSVQVARRCYTLADDTARPTTAAPNERIGTVATLAPVALTAVDVLAIVVAALGFGLLAAAICVAMAAVACLSRRPDDASIGAAPTLLVLLPALAATHLSAALGSPSTDLRRPALAVAAGLLLALVALWRRTRLGLVARAAVADATAARAIGLPLQPSGLLLLAAALVAAVGAGSALTMALPAMPSATLWAGAAVAGLATRNALAPPIAAAATGGAVGAMATVLLQAPPLIPALAMLLAGLIGSALRPPIRPDA